MSYQQFEEVTPYKDCSEFVEDDSFSARPLSAIRVQKVHDVKEIIDEEIQENVGGCTLYKTQSYRTFIIPSTPVRTRIQTVFVAFLLIHLKNEHGQTHALTCLQCTEIFQPRHCHVAVQCTQDEYCAVERTLNLQDDIVYNIGCRPNNLCDHRVGMSNRSSNNACFECCDTDLCNAQACGEPGYPATRGPACYHCGPSRDLSTCRTVQACQGHEVCFTERNSEFSDIIYISGCRDKHLCHNRRSSHSRDGMRLKKLILSGNHEKECCTTDLCNAKERTLIIDTAAKSSPSTPSAITNLTATTASRSITMSTTTHSRTTGILLTSCIDILKTHSNSTSGVYKIMPSGTNESIDVFCDMETSGGGWIVFQRRVDDSVNFEQNFSYYEFGFGLHALYILTTRNTTLRVDMTTAHNAKYYAGYSQFYIDSAPLYTVRCRGYSGTAGDTFNIHKFNSQNFDGMAFITPDRDNAGKCGQTFHAGWWYDNCFNANLNGNYVTPGTLDNLGIRWLDHLINEGSLQFVEMKLR